MSKHNCHHNKKETVTSGPFYVSRYSPTLLPNNRIVVTLKNPTHKKLSAFVTLGICKECPSPQAGGPGNYVSGCVDKIETLEKEQSLGWHHVEPMSCLRLEKTFDYYDLGNTVLRVEAKGDFNVDKESNTLLGGLLEISSIVGFIWLPGVNAVTLPESILTTIQDPTSPYYIRTGLDVPDSSTFVAFGDYVVVDHEHSDSSSSSSSSSSSY
ncbi:hypothetical protein [Paenibacillus bouchesdurhonensis]|uniref:hypothetical protein n=1 Tax=Paenibacillus bouchesdurhonensis TaxID=1870990 RepID=UPI000DA61EA5|nr:hypothetical protein [Paenibacillus bouchesdurhonensis]